MADVRDAQIIREDKTITNFVVTIIALQIQTLSSILTVLVQDVELELLIDNKGFVIIQEMIEMTEITTVVTAHNILNIVLTVFVLLAQNIRERQMMAEDASKMIVNTPNSTTQMMVAALIAHHLPEPITTVRNVKLMYAHQIKNFSVMEDVKIVLIIPSLPKIEKDALIHHAITTKGSQEKVYVKIVQLDLRFQMTREDAMRSDADPTKFGGMTNS